MNGTSCELIHFEEFLQNVFLNCKDKTMDFTRGPIHMPWFSQPRWELSKHAIFNLKEHNGYFIQKKHCKQNLPSLIQKMANKYDQDDYKKRIPLFIFIYQNLLGQVLVFLHSKAPIPVVFPPSDFTRNN